MFGLGKDQCLLPAVVVNQVGQQGRLFLLVDGVGQLGNRRCRCIARGYRDLNGVLHQPFGQLANIVGEGCREHQVLAALGQQIDNPLDIVDKAHIQHTVSFIQHQHFQLVKLHRILSVQINQPPRGGHQDIHPPAQLHHLRVDLDTAKDHRRCQGHMLAVNSHIFTHLGSQLTGWRQDQGAHPIGSGALATAQLFQYRQGKTGGLSSAGLGSGHHIPPFENSWYGFRLNGEGVS